MKLFLAILPIALMIQDSLAGTLGRFKRNDAAKHKIDSYVVKFDDWLERTAPIVKAVINDMPLTVEYSRYREDWETFLKMYEEEKHKIDGCLYKLYGVMHSLSHLYGPYHNLDAPAEAKKVQQLFYDNGFKQIEDEIREFMKTFDPEEIKKTAAQLTEDEAMQFLDKCR